VIYMWMLINDDCFNYLPSIAKKSVDLILVDPPYQISKESNFVKLSERTTKEMALKYGKVSHDFGEWDKEEIDFDLLFGEYKRVLRPGGTLIVFFDIWKSGMIREIATRNGFRVPRIGQWVKSNPVPINSKHTYLSNGIEFFFSFIKGKNATFNSEYDRGIYTHPLCNGKERLDHPTQKPLSLIKEIVEKHSRPGDLILDTFAGTGTTAHACLVTGRRYIMVERDESYYEMMRNRIYLETNQ
jgi:site-specific DNA-methyltransferase (adenine-specific)